MSKGKLIILSGPSGSGKTTLYRKLLASPRLKHKLVKSISATTRKKRPGEVNKRDYFFLSRKMFEYKARAGHFLEWQKVFDNYYGTPKKYVLDFLKQGKSVILAIDVKGAKVVKRIHKETEMIFIKPPSMEILKKRLRDRASDSDASISLRLEVAREEMKELHHYEHVVVNDDLSRTYKGLENLILKIINNKE